MTVFRYALAAFACCTLFISANQSHGQETLFTESFESDPGVTYALSAVFDDGQFDFFGRYAVPDAVNGARDDFLTGFDGGFAIFGQDHNGDPNSPNGESETQSITMAGIDISGKDALIARISLGALDSEPNFDNYETVDADGIQIFATIDGGTQTLIGEFAPNATGASDLYLDTDNDGVGDGTRLTTDLSDFTFEIGGLGNTLDLVIQMTSTDSFEPIVVDNVRIISVPEPSSAVVIGLLGIAGLARRKR